jgi:hypothetical protein
MNGIDDLENLASSIIEGGFDKLLGKQKLIAKLAKTLAQELTFSAQRQNEQDELPFQQIEIVVNPEDYQWINQNAEQLRAQLKQYLEELANERFPLPQQQFEFFFASHKDISTGDFVIQSQAGSGYGHKNRPDDDTRKFQIIPAIEAQTSVWHLKNDDYCFTLEEPVIHIGKDMDNDLCLDDPSVSGHHARLRWRDDAYQLFDLGSEKGTFVNDLPILQATLKAGDTIAFGNIILRLDYAQSAGKQ